MSKFKATVCDARCQQFQRECVRKEELLKTLWFLKNRKRLYDNLGDLSSSFKAKAIKRKKAHEEKPAEVELKPMKEWRPPGEEFDLMRPIKKDVLKILYTPKAESFISKTKYLKERYKSKPEDRFYYPYCASWDFGWRLKDYPMAQAPKYGRCSVIQSSFYRRNASSLQRDPDWYRMCQTGDPKNFNEILTY